MSKRRQGGATENRLLQVLGALGASSPGELVRASGLPDRTARAGLDRLGERGLVVRTKQSVRLTAAGRHEAVPLPVLPGDELDRITIEALLPSLAAWARLLADAVVFRLLFPEHSMQPDFIAYGPPKTAKTAAVFLVCHLLGLDWAKHHVLLSTLAPGELSGRRVTDVGGIERFTASPLLSLPLLCLEEFATANTDITRAARKLLQGDPTMLVEDHLVPVRSVPVVLFNPPDEAAFPPLLEPAFYRRAFTLCTDELEPIVRGMALQFADLFDNPPRRVIDLGRVRRALETLPEHVRRFLLSAAGEDGVLTTAGQEWWDLPKLAAATLGRAARWGLASDDDGRSAAAGVALDALACAETVPGQVIANWREGFAKVLPAWAQYLGDRPGAGVVLDAALTAQAGHAAIRATASRARRAPDAERLEFGGDQEELKVNLNAARKSIEHVPPAHRAAAARLRRQLKDAETWTGAARSRERVAELQELAQPVRDKTSALRKQIDDEVREQVAHDQAKAEQARITSEQAKARKKVADEDRKANDQRRTRSIAVAEQWRKKLEDAEGRRRVSPGESVLATLIALRAVSVYRWTAPPEPAPAPVRAVYKVLGKPPPEPLDQRAKRTAYVDFRGGLYWAHQLAQWGSPVVLDVLRAAIDVATVVHGNASAGRVVLTSADALPMPSVQALDEPGGP